MTERAEQIQSALFQQRDQFIALLREVVEIESPSTDPLSNMPAFHFFAREFEKLGFEVHHHPGNATAGQQLIYPKNRPKGKPLQFLTGHVDTVWPKGTLAEMPCEIKEGKMFGPGIYDMKAGLVEIVMALRVIRELGLEMPVTPVMLLTSDEEIGSHESRQNIHRLAKIAERCFVLEPALGFEAKLKTSRKGVGMFHVTVLGKSAHSGLEPEKGRNAIIEMSNVIQKVQALNNPEKGTTVNVGTIEGGERINVIAAKAKISVDVRVVTHEEAERVDRDMRALSPTLEGFSLEISGGIDRPPMEKNEANTRLWEVAYELGRELDLELEDGRSGGASDGNLTSQHCATLDGLGAVGDGAHALHEHIVIDDTLTRAGLLAMLMVEDVIS